MNNQVKLIDENKLLEWINTMYNKKLPDELKEYRDGRQVVLDLLEIQIKSGRFAPDTPPVPTIKPGDKVRHVGTGTAGKVAQVTEVGAFVHWSTGQRSWYPFSYLEVVE
jgi:hypothetical protein